MSHVGRRPTLREPTQLSIAFDKEQWDAVEAFQRARRITSVTEAVRALVWRGLESEGAAPPLSPAPKKKGR